MFKSTVVIAGHTGRMDALKAAVLPLVRATATVPDAVCVIFLDLPEADTINIDHSLLGYNLRRIFFRHDKGVLHCLVCHAAAGDGDASSMRGRPVG